MTEFELKILRECADQLPASPWGAAIGAAYDSLKGNGYLDRDGAVTDAGYAYLAEHPLEGDTSK